MLLERKQPLQTRTAPAWRAVWLFSAASIVALLMTQFGDAEAQSPPKPTSDFVPEITFSNSSSESQHNIPLDASISSDPTQIPIGLNETPNNGVSLSTQIAMRKAQLSGMKSKPQNIGVLMQSFGLELKVASLESSMQLQRLNRQKESFENLLFEMKQKIALSNELHGSSSPKFLPLLSEKKFIENSLDTISKQLQEHAISTQVNERNIVEQWKEKIDRYNQNRGGKAKADSQKLKQSIAIAKETHVSVGPTISSESSAVTGKSMNELQDMVFALQKMVIALQHKIGRLEEQAAAAAESAKGPRAAAQSPSLAELRHRLRMARFEPQKLERRVANLTAEVEILNKAVKVGSGSQSELARAQSTLDEAISERVRAKAEESSLMQLLDEMEAALKNPPQTAR